MRPFAVCSVHCHELSTQQRIHSEVLLCSGCSRSSPFRRRDVSQIASIQFFKSQTTTKNSYKYKPSRICKSTHRDWIQNTVSFPSGRMTVDPKLCELGCAEEVGLPGVSSITPSSEVYIASAFPGDTITRNGQCLIRVIASVTPSRTATATSYDPAFRAENRTMARPTQTRSAVDGFEPRRRCSFAASGGRDEVVSAVCC